MTVEKALTELEDMLPGLNYMVRLDLHRVPAIPDGTPEQYVRAALGQEPVIWRTCEVALADMLTDVEQCLRWAGDEGSHPDEEAIRSPRLDELVSVVRSHLARAAAGASVWSFCFKSGNPHYPVQWHFEYVLAGPGGAEVFIGSSSD